jgi:hypothetical protein
MILSAQMTTASTKYGNKKIASKSENEWWKKGEWRTERGSGAEVVIPIVISVVLRVNVLEKQVHGYFSDPMKPITDFIHFFRQI